MVPHGAAYVFFEQRPATGLLYRILITSDVGLQRGAQAGRKLEHVQHNLSGYNAPDFLINSAQVGAGTLVLVPDAQSSEG